MIRTGQTIDISEYQTLINGSIDSFEKSLPKLIIATCILAVAGFIALYAQLTFWAVLMLVLAAYINQMIFGLCMQISSLRELFVLATHLNTQTQIIKNNLEELQKEIREGSPVRQPSRDGC